MLRNATSFPGFTALSDKIHLLEPTSTEHDNSTQLIKDPKTIFLYTWGDGQPKHIRKYTDGYRKLFPTARIILVQCTMLEAMFQPVTSHNRSMLPVIDAVFSNGDSGTAIAPEELLVHVMSNSGMVNFISTIMTYQSLRQQTTLTPFPHALLILDSAAGSLTFFSNATRWSRALALATASWSPFPSVIMQVIWAIIITTALGLATLFRSKRIGRTIVRGVRDPGLTSKESVRLYLYSKGDELVTWTSVEEHIADVKEMGFTCLSHVFQKSPHVSHARMYPERYWGFVLNAWELAVTRQTGERGNIPGNAVEAMSQ